MARTRGQDYDASPMAPKTTRRPLPLAPLPRLRHLPPWLVCLLVLCALLVREDHAGAAGALPAPGAYTVDASSTVGFSVTEFLINSVSGTFSAFSGHVTVGDSFATSQIQATVNVASVDTGIHMRDEHLVSPEFFDAARFPQMQFTSTQIWGTPNNFGIKGNLTIKGTTKEVVFSARILDSGVVVAETKIDRTVFGLTSGSTIKNDVQLRLQIRMTRAPQAP
jgi:polyisoprenoid-binding protein YceI